MIISAGQYARLKQEIGEDFERQLLGDMEALFPELHGGRDAAERLDVVRAGIAEAHAHGIHGRRGVSIYVALHYRAHGSDADVEGARLLTRYRALVEAMRQPSTGATSE